MYIACMSVQGAIHCYLLIIERISLFKHASFAEIKQHLENNDFNLSDRTIQRYIQHIRDEYKIEITYNRSNNSYAIDESQQADLNQLKQLLLKMHEGASISKQLDFKSMQYIQTDNNELYGGIKWFNQLLEVIKQNRQVRLTYQKFGEQQSKSYLLEPYLLKEYAQRWYVYALDTAQGVFKTFGLERIKQIEVCKKKFKRNSQVNPKAVFNSIIGISLPNAPATTIVLKVNNNHVAYLETVPLHQSQEKIRVTKNHTWFKLQLCINFELVQKILMHAAYTEVVEPPALRKEIKTIALKILKLHH
jgi:predicted DNA-binding transcriptional regulator YafY